MNMQSNLSPKKYIQTKVRSLPIHECYINSGWEESGLAHIFISRKQPSGNFIIGIYLVDLYATGLKDTFYLFNQTATEYDELINLTEEEYEIESCNYELAHNIIYEGISYAEEFGFTPHKDFEISKYIIQEDTEDIEEIHIECGLNGKPCVVVFQDDLRTKTIAQLERTIGKGNFSVIQPGEEDDLEDLEEEDDVDEEDEFEEEDEDNEEDLAGIAEKLETLEYNAAKSYEELFGHADEDKLDEERLIPPVIIDEHLPDITLLPLNEQEEVFELSELTSLESVDRKTISRLKSKIKKFPDSPIFYELLSAAYRQNGELKEAENLLEKAIEKFPGHLLTRISYGYALIINNKMEAFKNCFGGKIYLDEIAPGRPHFYKAEVRFFLQTMLVYFIATDAFHTADEIMQAVKKLNDNEEPGMDVTVMRLTLLAAKLRKIATVEKNLSWPDETIKATIESIN